MERVTHAQIKEVFGLLLKAMGRRKARSIVDVGGWRLNYSRYGGWIIEAISNPGGGVRSPCGDRRRRSKDMLATMHFALDVLRERKR
jgi:hypothetical protein